MLKMGNDRIEAKLKYGGWWTIASADATVPEQIYTWTSAKTGVPTTWAVGKLRHIVSRSKPVIERKAIELAIVHRLTRDGGLEGEHVQMLVKAGMNRVSKPGLIVRDAEGEIIVDGAHRYVARAILNVEDWMDFFIIDMETAKAAELDLTAEDRAKLADIHEMAKFFIKRK